MASEDYEDFPCAGTVAGTVAGTWTTSGITTFFKDYSVTKMDLTCIVLETAVISRINDILPFILDRLDVPSHHGPDRPPGRYFLPVLFCPN